MKTATIMAAVKSVMLVEYLLLLSHIILQMLLYAFLTQCSFQNEDSRVNNFLLRRFALKIITDRQFIVLVGEFYHCPVILMVQQTKLERKRRRYKQVFLANRRIFLLFWKQDKSLIAKIIIILRKNCQHISQRADSKYENSIFNIANNGDFTPRYPTVD